jgi:diguanylate cyclase (GGDEF)-like protein/PAS domain S-box-containing protein
MTPVRLGGLRFTARGPAAWLPWILLAHVPVVGIMGLARGRSLDHVGLDMAPVALFAGLAFWPAFTERMRSVAVAMGLMIAAEVFVHLSGGQVESHFYFFVLLGLLALYDDWLPYAAAALQVLLEHGLVGVIAPAEVFGNQESNTEALRLALVHGVYVLAASAVYLTVWRWQKRQRLLTQRKLSEMDELTRLAFEASASGLAVVTLDGTLVRLNGTLCRLVGAPESELVGRHLLEISGTEESRDVWGRIQAWAAEGRGELEFRTEYIRPDGRHLWVQATMALVRDENGEPQHMLAQVDDVTDEVESAARLAHSATHDALTDLANRTALEERLQPMIAAANRRDEVLGCLFIDLDDFKSVNDDHGHDVGDALLSEVADRIRSCLRVEDFVARLGGDEFVVLASLADGDAVDQLASRMIAAICQSFEHDGQRLRVRCSIGVALHVDADPARPNALVKAADIAMYRAKASGRGTWVRFRPGEDSMPEPPNKRAEVEARFRQLLDSTTEPVAIHCEGEIVAVSNALVRLIGASDDRDIVGRELEEFLTPDSRAVSARRRAAVAAGGWPDPENVRLVTFQGTLVDVEVWSHPVMWGSRVANQVHLRTLDSPLTEIARLGIELVGPRTEAVIVMDLDLRIVAWNQHATELLGWTAEEAIGRRVDEVIGSPDEAEVDSIGRGLADAGEWIGVQPSPTKDGTVIDVHLHTRYVRDWRGNELGLVTVAHGVLPGAEAPDALMEDLARAIDDDELVVHYQPMVRAEDGIVVKVEALVRWQHRELGLLPPAQFIPLAEGTPLMGRISRKVLEIAAHQVAAWRRDLLPALELAVNISANELADPQLAADVSAVLGRSGLPAGALWLEVTETSVADDPTGALEGLARVRKLGCHTALDDFGTGFATLAQLHLFPVQAIKIDRLFVAGLTEDPGDAAIVRSVVNLANEIGMTVIAEGVETEEQRRALRLLGCNLLQGYLLGVPSPAEPTPRWALRSSVEQDRLAALRSCRVLDTEPEPTFDRIVDLAARLCRSPMAYVAFIDADRLWLKARVGIEDQELARTWAFADHALDSLEPMVVPDAHLDDRFKSNPLVTGPPCIRAYVAVPLVLEDGFTVGTLCVLDRQPRLYGPTQLGDLQTLAGQVVAELGVRRSIVELTTKSVVAAVTQTGS